MFICLVKPMRWVLRSGFLGVAEAEIRLGTHPVTLRIHYSDGVSSRSPELWISF